MAQSLIAFYCFNDNDTSLVHDFSVNERHSSSETALTITADTGAVGKVGVFNGTTSEVDFGNITAFNSLAAFSIVVKFKIDTLPAATGYIVRRDESFNMYVNNSGDIGITIHDTAGIFSTLIHAAGLVAGVWYTIVATWDTENIKYYRDTDTVRDTEGAAFATMHNPSSSLYIGSGGGSSYFQGKIEMISFYSKCITSDEINAVMEYPSGIKYESGDGMIQTGDLIYNNSGAKEVCTWSEEFDERNFNDDEQHLFNDGEVMIFPN